MKIANKLPGARQRTRRRACVKTALACLAALAGAAALAGENDAIATDRPDFVESSNVVGAGRWQVETGFARERGTDGAGPTTSTPTLLRFGVGPRWELRAETDGRIAARGGSNGAPTSYGYGDLALGFKWHAQDQQGMRPSLALLGHVDLATGSPQWRGSGARPSLRLVAEWELGMDMSLGIMPGLIADKNEQGERYVGAIFGLVLGKAWNAHWRSFAELAASQIASSANGGSRVTFDLGAAWLLSPRVQLDMAYNKGMNRHTPDSTALGLSVKF